MILNHSARDPVFEGKVNMTVHFEKLVAGFSRYHKYTLGTELREGSRAVLQQVLRANNAATREQRAAEQAGRVRLRAAGVAFPGRWPTHRAPGRDPAHPVGRVTHKFCWTSLCCRCPSRCACRWPHSPPEQ